MFSSPGNISQILTNTDSPPKVQTLLWFNIDVYDIVLKAKVASAKSSPKLTTFSLDLGQSNPSCTWAKVLVFSDEAKRLVLETFLVILLQDAWHSWKLVKESDARKQMKAAMWLKGIAETELRTGFGLYHWTFMRPNMIWKLFQQNVVHRINLPGSLNSFIYHCSTAGACLYTGL